MTNNEPPKKEEKEPPKEEVKKPNSIADRIKNMKSGEPPKKEEKEKPKEEAKKTSSIADRIKNMTSNEQANDEIKKTSSVQIKFPRTVGKNSTDSSSQQLLTTKSNTINPPSNIGAKKTTKQPAVPGSFSSKLSQMSEMFKNKGMGKTGHRPSMLIGMPQNFKFGQNSGGSKGSVQSNDIITEEPDKMKAGYDPAANLQKTLDSVVVVKKDKKKKKKPTTFTG